MERYVILAPVKLKSRGKLLEMEIDRKNTIKLLESQLNAMENFDIEVIFEGEPIEVTLFRDLEEPNRLYTIIRYA